MADLGKILLTPKGNYDASTTYDILDWIRYSGKVWVSKHPNNTGNTPAANEHWALLVQDGSGGGGGGSSVAWNQIVTTGTKIATITINEVPIDVFAPAGGSSATWSTLEGRPFNTLGSDFLVPGTGETDAGVLKLSTSITQKLANLDADGEIDYSHVKNTPNLDLKADKSTTYTKTEVDNKVDGWVTTTDQATATGEANIRFNVSDTSKAYKLFYESSNNGVVNQKAVSVSGNTITYTVDVPSTTNVPVTFKLRVFN